MRSPRALVTAVLAILIAAACACGSSGSSEPPNATSTLEQASSRGAYGVGVTTFEVTDTSRPTEANGTYAGAPERKLVVELWYPADPSVESPEARDVPLYAADAPYPLIIFSHGLSSSRRQSWSYTEHLASHGYIVAAPDFPLSQGAAPGGPSIAAVVNQPEDVSFLIDQLLQFNAQDGHLLHAAIDEDRIGLSGHSLGGATTYLTTYGPKRDPRVRASLPISNVGCFGSDDLAGDVSVPIMFLVGTDDLITPPRESERSYGVANPPKYLVELRGADHIRFADVDLEDAVAVSGLQSIIDNSTAAGDFTGLIETFGVDTELCGLETPTDSEKVTGARQREMLRTFAIPFFDAYLRGSDDAKRFLDTELPGLVPEAQVEMATK